MKDYLHIFIIGMLLVCFGYALGIKTMEQRAYVDSQIKAMDERYKPLFAEKKLIEDRIKAFEDDMMEKYQHLFLE